MRSFPRSIVHFNNVMINHAQSYCVKSLRCPIVFPWIQFLVESLPVFAQPGILRKQTKPLSSFCSNTWEIPHNPLDLNRSMLLLIPARAPFYLSISLLFAFWRSNDMKRTTHPRNQQKKITEMSFTMIWENNFSFMFSSFYLWCQMQPAPFSVWQWFIIYLPYSQRSRPAKPTCQPHAQCTLFHKFTPKNRIRMKTLKKINHLLLHWRGWKKSGLSHLESKIP